MHKICPIRWTPIYAFIFIVSLVVCTQFRGRVCEADFTKPATGIVCIPGEALVLFTGGGVHWLVCIPGEALVLFTGGGVHWLVCIPGEALVLFTGGGSTG